MSVALPLLGALAGALLGPPRPRPPARIIKPADGYFEDTLALDRAGRYLAAVRTDGETFAKIDEFDLAAPLPGPEVLPQTPLWSADVPDDALAVERLELLPGGKGVVLISRDGGLPGATMHATLIDDRGQVAARVGPATAFGRPARADAPGAPPDVLLAFDRTPRRHHDGATYTITPYALSTLAPAGKPRTWETDAAGVVLPGPRDGNAIRVVAFSDGYGHMLVEEIPARAGILDTRTGQISDVADIGDVVAWAEGARLRADHPDRARFAALNQNGSGVDIVDLMGNRHATALAVPFELYDRRSLRDQEGPEPGAFWLSLSTDPLNASAVKRRRPDLPMLDLYAFDAAKEATTLRARVFTPRPVF